MSKTLIPEDLKGKELFKYLIANKSKLIATKKASLKYTDSIIAKPSIVPFIKTSATKAIVAPTEDELEEPGVLHVKVVANTAWICDHAMDVLTDKCYDKSIKEKGILIPHIADHIHTSTNHVGDVKAVYTEKLDLKDLGLDMPGKTTALIFETDVKEEYNELTYVFYKNGKINAHSIGLIYISIGLCINDEESIAEFDLWNKYYDKVINKDVIDEAGYFWIVPEIRVIENSSVMFPCNELTPTLSISDTGKNQPQISTDKQPPSTEEKEEVTKSVIGCPDCDYLFVPQPDSTPKCPNCGCFVSPNSTTIMLSDETFDWKKAIEETIFI